MSYQGAHKQHTHVYKHRHRCRHRHTHTKTHTHINTHTHTHAYTYTYIPIPNIPDAEQVVSSRQDEFTCNIGTCIPLPQRCNGHDDCGDDSDETCKLLLPLPSSYRRSRPPELFTAVALSAEFVGYQSIDVSNNLVNVELKVGRIIRILWNYRNSSSASKSFCP